LRYHIHGHFIEEQRKGFAVHHEIDKHCDTAVELTNTLNLFTSDYDSRYCYGLSIGVAEEPSLVE